MINIVFEGATITEKTSTIKKIRRIYDKNYKVGFTSDIERLSPLYNVIKKKFKENVLVSLNEKFNPLQYETLVQATDYLYLREKLYGEENDINLFDRNYSSVYSYQSVLLEENIEGATQFMDNVLSCMKSGEQKVDLMVFFDIDLKISLKHLQEIDKRKLTKVEKETFKKFNDKLKDFIRYNNSEYKLLVISSKDSEKEIIKKITEKIDEIIEDRKKQKMISGMNFIKLI